MRYVSRYPWFSAYILWVAIVIILAWTATSFGQITTLGTYEVCIGPG